MGLLRLIGFLAAAAAVSLAAGPSAEALARQAEKAERAGETVRAYLLYAQAAVADRLNPAYWAKAEGLRPLAEAQSATRLPHPELTGAEPHIPPAGGANVVGAFTADDLDAIERMKPPPHLQPSALTPDFALKGEAKTLWEQVAAKFGYTVIFDKDYNPPGTVRFHMSEVEYRDAIHALESATNSFVVPISENAMLVAQDTPQKRTELENDEALAIPIPQRTSIQEAQEMLVLVQQAFDIRRAMLDPQRRMILLRDRVSKVETARAILGQLEIGKPQVSIEVEFISSAESSSLSLGLSLPNQFPVVNFGRLLANAVPNIPTGFLNFLAFGGGRTLFGIGITNAQLFATASRSNATSLLRSTLVAGDGQPASLHVGNKYPIVTGGYLPVGNVPGNNNGGTSYAVISTTPYADEITSAISTTGSMELVVNGTSIPFTLPTAINNLSGLQSVINSLQGGVYASVVQVGTNSKQLSLALLASSLTVTSIQLIDDPSGAKIELMKATDIVSAISNDYNDATTAKVSSNLSLDLAVGKKTFPLTLTTETNNLNGLRDAINNADAGVTASVLLSSNVTGTRYLQVVANAASSGVIQVYDDPAGANTALLTSTTEVDAIGSQLGTSTSGSNLSNTSLGQIYTPPPTFNFEDLGLVMKITPFVHNADELSLEVEAEFKTLGSGSFNGVPVISTRKFQGKVRLRSSEWAVVAGLVSDTRTDSITGIPGLMHLPGVGVALRDNEKSHDRANVLLVIKPRVLSLPPSEYPTRTLWVGSETRPLSAL